MNDSEFLRLMNALAEYLEREKIFIKNPARFADVEAATEIATELFADAKISVKDDPIQMGALIICIEAFDIVIRGEREIRLFKQLIDKADNFEIYPVGKDSLRFSMVFNGALKRI